MLKLGVYVNKPQITFIFLLLLCGSFLTFNLLSILASPQTQNNQSVKSQEPHKVPKVKFNRVDTTDTVDRRLRAARNSRYDTPSGRNCGTAIRSHDRS